MGALTPAAARELLEGYAYPETRDVQNVHLVEPGCICFTSRTAIGDVKAWTAVLRDGPHGPNIPRILPGWPLPDQLYPPI